MSKFLNPSSLPTLLRVFFFLEKIKNSDLPQRNDINNDKFSDITFLTKNGQEYFIVH